MEHLLDWAKPGAELLVGLTDPLDASAEPALVAGRLELDAVGEAVVIFTPPDGGAGEAAAAYRLGDAWGAVHITRSGVGRAIWVFAPDSIGHLRWQIRDAKRRIQQLLRAGELDDPSTARELTVLTSTLHQLVCRAALLAEPTGTAIAA